MKLVNQEVVVVPTNGSFYRNYEGGLGILWFKRVQWFTCRELFHRSFRWIFWRRGFFFSSPKEQRELVADFINVLEDRLNLKTKSRFNRTNLPWVMRVKPAPFWYKQTIRFSLYTILLRTALNHKKDRDITLTFKMNTYAREGWAAISRFMSGKTYYTGYKLMWYSQFGNANANIPCCWRSKCNHKNQRCQKKLDNLLVPSWQAGGIHYLVRFGKMLKSIASFLAIR